MLMEETFNFLTRLLNYIFAIPMLILGITGSILIVIVITQKRTFRQNTNLTYLLAGAIMTGIHLPTIYIQMILVYGFNVSLMNTNEAACREHTYLRYVTTVAAISAIIRNRWGSLRVVRLVIVCTVIFWFLFYIPVIFFTGITNGVCNFKPSLYTTLNTYIFTPLVYGLGPVGVITYCILGTVKNLRLNNIQRSHEKLAKQVRAMLIPQLIILAISGIPFGFQNIYLDITSHIAKDAKRIAIENFLGQVVLIFYHFNYVFTFYIYVYKSSEFRKVLKKQVPRCIRACRLYPTDVIINNSIKPLEINETNFTQTV
ncbi:unnamed protein product [Adineta steineri]|uniref:G-protein coupled receptors family 1 profile domain-containing protein n=1 Tax=Adineta steineri TaxID=433720 RepID=A0A813XJR9_9BILA|nr:unnamed protein product [Adineta steineri]CAF3878843.1 unnamed protein product [Adineta steineri]